MIKKWVLYLIIALSSLWGALSVVCALKLWNFLQISKFIATLELGVQILTIFTAFKIYKNITDSNKKIFLWFIGAITALLFNDLFFYIFIYIEKVPETNVPYKIFLSYYIPFLFWLAAGTVFLTKILVPAILKLKYFLRLLSVFLIFDCVVIFLFFLSMKHNASISSIGTISLIVKNKVFVYTLIFFDLIILCLICTEETGMVWLLSGMAVIISANFLFNYSSIAQIENIIVYAELFWFLGIMFICFGVLLINQNKMFDIKKSFTQTNAIKSRLGFWTFGVAITSFLLFFIVAYAFSLIDNVVFSGLPFFITAYTVIVVIFSLFMGKYFERPFKKLAYNIEAVMLNQDTKNLDNSFSIEEFIFLEKFILTTFKINQEKDRVKRQLGEVAAQVAHDIRSPLTAMNVCLQNLPQMPEKQRVTLRNASNRINDIATNLLSRYKNPEAELHINETEMKSWLITPIIESMIVEKRLQLQSQPITLEVSIAKETYFLFAKLELREFKRVLSNLLNNSAEAFCEKSGFIMVGLRANSKNILIEIADNGCGISTEKLATIFESGITTKIDGSGIGLAHAKKVIEIIGGEINIQSEVNRGTIVSINLPSVSSPHWFASNIVIDPSHQIIILDDDESIHGAWDARLNEVSRHLNILHFRKGHDFSEWHNKNKNVLLFVLSDYELLGELKTGLDILEELRIGKRGLLITSHYEKTDIIDRCLTAGIKLLPKNLVAYIPIELKNEDTASGAVNVANRFLSKYDYILIDNDNLIREMWAMQAEIHGKRLRVFDGITMADKEIFQHDRDVIIYIDSELEDGQRGEKYAKKLYEAGFRSIYLATAYGASQFAPMYWITAIVGKDTPF